MVKKPNFEGYKKRLRTFKQYRDLSEPEFNKIAKELYDKKYSKIEQSIVNQEVIENSIGIWLNQEEADEAKKLFDTYIEKNSITNFSDITLLKSLVYYEIQLRRIQYSINNLAKKAEEKGNISIVHTTELRMMNEINEQILSLKKVLGLSDDKKGKDPLEYISILKKKMFAWARELYQAHRFRECPHCSKPIMLLMRPEVWEAYKHPFFRDKVLANDWVWQLYKEGKITKLDVAKILLGKDVKSTIYADWLEKKIYNVQDTPDPLLESGHD